MRIKTVLFAITTFTLTMVLTPLPAAYAAGADLTGTIKTTKNADICAMVLASGQFIFSCNPNGVFSLAGLPSEKDGTVKRQIYADGFLPKIDRLPGSRNDSVIMNRAGNCPKYNALSNPGVFPNSAFKRINIAGKVLLQNSQSPLCALVLANGQRMFTCDGSGRYAMNIPLDNNGQFKLQVFADPFAPTIQTFDEFQATNDVRLALASECQPAASLNQAAFNSASNNYEFGFLSIRNINIANAPADTDLNRGAMLHDGSNYRLYFFKKNSNTTLYQFAFNSATGRYEYGFNSIRQLRVTGAPAQADASNISMLHDGTNYRLYMGDTTVAGRVHQFAFNPATSNYEYGFRSIAFINTTGAPSDADFRRRAMLHDGTDYRMYVFKSGSATRFYQFAFNPATNSYAYGFRSIANLTLVGMPGVSASSSTFMLHDGGNYRLYQPQLD